MKFHGFGTVWSQNAAWVSTPLGACGTLPFTFPPSGGRRFGSVFAWRCPAKFTGSAGSRMVFATTRNWRYAEFAPGWIPSPARSAFVVETNEGEVVKTSTTVPPPTLSTAREIRGFAATSAVPWIGAERLARRSTTVAGSMMIALPDHVVEDGVPGRRRSRGRERRWHATSCDSSMMSCRKVSRVRKKFALTR